MTLHGPDPERFRTKVYGARWYIDPLPADALAVATDDKWPSVTTIKKAWSKPFRKKLETGELVSLDAFWAAEFIVDHLDTVESLSDDRDAALALVAAAPTRRLNKAANRGTAVHTVMEDLMAGKGVGFVDPAVEPFVAGCKAFVEDWRPTPVATEFVVINRSIGFGGTGDAILALEREGKPWLAMVDYKSRGGDHGCYEEDVAQIGGYSLADYMVVLGSDGRPTRMALPEIDGGLVVSLTAEGYAAYPVDLAEARAAFCRMHDSWHAHREGQKAARRARGNPLVLASETTSRDPADRPTLSGSRQEDGSREGGDQPAAGSDGGAVAPSESAPVAGPAPDPRVVGVSIDIALFGKDDKPVEGYEAGVWQDPDRPAVFGLMYGGTPTVMSYGLDYFKPVEVIAKNEERFYFDAGGNGRPIWCTRDELERVFVALGLVTVDLEKLADVFNPPPLSKPLDPEPDGDPSTPALGQDPALVSARIAWLSGRVDAIKAAGHASVLARHWSEHPEVPTFKNGGPTTAEEVDVVSEICWAAEGEVGLPFPDPDPAVAVFEAEAKAKGLV